MPKICKSCGAMNGNQATICSRCHKPLQNTGAPQQRQTPLTQGYTTRQTPPTQRSTTRQTPPTQKSTTRQDPANGENYNVADAAYNTCTTDTTGTE